MLSIINPFYKKFSEFVTVFTHNNLAKLNAFKYCELILCIDDPHEHDELLKFIQTLQSQQQIHFNVKLILNIKPHDWRCPSRAINVGIKHAKFDKLLVLSPETIILEQSLQKLFSSCNETNFAVGIIKHATINEIQFDQLEKNFNDLPKTLLPYGSICFTKFQAFKVGGYDENYSVWGGDDDDFRTRLEMAGFKKHTIFAKFLHVKMPMREMNLYQARKFERSQEQIQKKLDVIKEKQSYLANCGNFGNEFDQVIFDFVTN